MKEIEGVCYCGQTTYTVQDPQDNLKVSAFCHCSRCQRLNGAPCIWTTHWKAEGVIWHAETQRYEVVEGVKYRLRCKNCGVPLGTWNERKKQWSLWPVHFRLRGDKSNRLRVEDVEWLKPTAHIFYSTRIVEIADTLPKYEGYEGESERIQ
ncbi:hypothetical protein P389DRAFT_165174 [Cystobasidium minutum MCA 4210]|uniref:uncharacterized protein n=1 Tax=Cystobasidium minutum MCA 4210 TaxID=1397322 RepID=UPI0034CFD1BB|eukprot:jgi/Rhomi1/165174/fgenesh1_kg.1_\